MRTTGTISAIIPRLLVDTGAIDVSLVAGGDDTPRRLRNHNNRAATPVNNTKPAAPPTTPYIQAGVPLIDDASMLGVVFGIRSSVEGTVAFGAKVGGCEEIATAVVFDDGDDTKEVDSAIAVVVDIESSTVDSGFVAPVICVDSVTDAVPALVDTFTVRVVVLDDVDVVTAVDFVVLFVVTGAVAVVVAFDVGVVGFVVDNDVVIDCVTLVDIKLGGHKRLDGDSHVQLPPFCRQLRELAMSCRTKR